MPKYRQLHLKIIDSQDVNEMPDDFTRLTWIMLFLIMDSSGRGNDNPAWVRSKMYPLREDVTLDQINVALDWFEDRGMIIRYSKEGRKYFYIPTWSLYQSGTEREAPSSIPTPDQVASNSGVSTELLPSKAKQSKAILQSKAKQSNGTPDLDSFSVMQHTIEEITGVMPDREAAKAINEILEMGATSEDVGSGYHWLKDNEIVFRYYRQLVGPSRTAMARRIQKNNNGRNPDQPRPHQQTPEEIAEIVKELEQNEHRHDLHTSAS